MAEKLFIEDMWDWSFPESITVPQPEHAASGMSACELRLKRFDSDSYVAYVGQDQEGLQIVAFAGTLRDGTGEEVNGLLDVYTDYSAVSLDDAGVDPDAKTLASEIQGHVPFGVGGKTYADCGGSIRDLERGLCLSVSALVSNDRANRELTREMARNLEQSQARGRDQGGIGR